ncbi:hypothetical protein OG858_47440 (plasmid) [Streptomyces europaeiscabiei]|uniref:DUF6884 domain-containing protein n=1 Tax=Streptomyces europaeiscabiei TaxID=146819 RepID=UPI002E81FF73|nr:DUF6884 domain-containing protein [Streptomyces europaeiscabiei]WUD38834.1 hypothetical protein OG858_47440 [Streptomyces europaeiscabiei]
MMTNGEHGTRRGRTVDEYAAPRKRAYTGVLAWADRMYADGERGEVVVRVHDAGQLGNVRREAAEQLADGYGVRARRFEEAIYFSRQGGRHTGENVRVARHALRIEGPVLKVARFAADLPQVLAAIEQAATTMMRTLNRWMRDSAHGQRWMACHDAAHWRTERRYWRRSYIRHLAQWTGPEATDMSGADMPDWSENWLNLQARIAQATAGTVDVEAARDHMAEALLFAQAARPEPRTAEPLPEPRTRYATVYDAIHAPVQRNEEIGNVEFHYGDPAELTRQKARDEAPAPVPAEEPAAPTAAEDEAQAAAAAQLALFGAESTAPAATAAAGGPVVVIPCSGRKLGRPAPAGEIYTGSLHRMARRTADALTATGGTVLVLSALHGLTPLDRVIEPYDHQWTDSGSITVGELRAQAEAFGLADAESVILLTPGEYTRRAAAVWPHARTPLAHLGIGQQRGRLAALRADNLTIAA